MEDNVQTIIMSLVAIIIFFIFPTYIAYEKKDDIAYSIALKATQTFVDNVRSKGYVSKDMYSVYVGELAKSGNSYDIQLEHMRKRVDPVTNMYTENTTSGEAPFVKTNFTNQEWYRTLSEEERNDLTTGITAPYKRVENTYTVSTELIKSSQIMPLLANETIYQMNIGDEFAVVLKNTNITPATIFFNIVTINATDKTNTRIYVNYGGSITNETWRGKKQYKEYTTVAPMSDMRVIELGTNVNFDGTREVTPTEKTGISGIDVRTYENNFSIEFEARPNKSILLPDQGNIVTTIASDHNYLIKEESYSNSTSTAGMGVSIGTNGVSIVLNAEGYYYSVLKYSGTINTNSQFKIQLVDRKPSLYINGILVSEGIIPPIISGKTEKTKVVVDSKAGKGNYGNYYGSANNFKFYSLVEQLDMRVIDFSGSDIFTQTTLDSIKLPTATSGVIATTEKTYEKNFVVEFKALPDDSTGIYPLGERINITSSVDDRKFNYILPDSVGYSNVSGKANMGVSVGINGVQIVAAADGYYYSILSYDGIINTYSDIKVVVQANVPYLYINGTKAASGIAPPKPSAGDTFTEKTALTVTSKLRSSPYISGTYRNYDSYTGKANNFKFYSFQDVEDE